MNILLINPPDRLEKMLGVAKTAVPRYEPLGLLYIAALCREKGHVVRFIDSFAEGKSLEDVKQSILETRPGIVGISTLTCSGAAVWELGQWIKQTLPGTPVVLGNVHASVFAKQYLENGCCDFVVHGEGEYAFLGIVEACAGKGDKGAIAGISFMNDAKVVTTGHNGYIGDLSALPFPARDLIDPTLYNLGPISNQVFFGGAKSVTRTISSSRGCFNRCYFCTAHRNLHQRFNDPVRVVDEMELLVKEHGATYLTFVDTLFVSNRERLLRICGEITKRGLKVQWGAEAYVNQLSPEIVRAMEAAGCYDLAIGIESGVQRLLDNVNKRITIERVRQAVDIIKNNSKILIEGLFILGLPGETRRDSLETIRFAKSLDIDMAQFSTLTPYPGSPLFEDLRARGQVNTGVREDGSVDPSAWDRYSAYTAFTDIEPIWVTPGLTSGELKKLQKKAQREFYLRPSMIRRNIKRLTPGNALTAVRLLIRGFF